MIASVPAAIMRGGTSKGVFLHASHVPEFGSALDRFLLEVMGSPDPMQIDGLGGTHSSTSKVMIVAPGDGAVDVRYWFAQVGVNDAVVDWAGNCGNLTTAVGVFAIEQGLVPAIDPCTILRMRNENTGIVVECSLPVIDGAVVVSGAAQVAGVVRGGAPIVTRYLSPGGGVLGALLPTGRVADEARIDGSTLAVSLVDITHPYAFVAADDIGAGLHDRSIAELNDDVELLRRAERVRTAASELLHAEGVLVAPSPAIPRLILVSRADRSDEAGHHDIRALAVSMQRFHHALPITGALCLAGAAALPGSIPAQLGATRDRQPYVIRHPKGNVEVSADVDSTGAHPIVNSVGIVRTARTLMTGEIHLHPDSRY